MAKATGLGDLLFVDGYDLSGDVGAVQTISAPSNPLDVTGINKSALERIYGLADGLIEFSAFFNDAANQEHAVLKAKPAGNRIVSYFKGSAIGNMAASLVAKQNTFDWTRGADGSLVGTIQCQGSNGAGLEYGGKGGASGAAADGQLTAGKRTDTAATNGASLDCLAASALGLSAVLHVFAFTGTSVTVTIQESSDDAVGDPFAAVVGGAFAAASAIGAERIVTSLTLSIERYLRVVTTGTFTNAVFAVSFTRYPR